MTARQRKIKRVLVANRGEIAVRIIRACRELDLETVAVYSEADRRSPFVHLADTAVYIGPAESSLSYLNMEKIIEAAWQTGADAIHPGYGFLAENAVFARKVEDKGLVFVGPTPETIELMGHKTASREAMRRAGVPVVPGTEKSVKSTAEAREIVASMDGYPIMLKAAAGGGGKGMRIVRHDAELDRALEAAQDEAQKAFGDASIYIEKYIENPRHIEIQILADQAGNIVHLYERECSIQRRHQKLIEECPSSVLTPAQRSRMGKVAIQAARACHYRGAGTIEFLYDASGKFYFLEMNTRLQVEHTVTEMALGMDLVKLQLLIAAGNPLPFTQTDIQPQGHAIECRINAEDVYHDFTPSIGKITAFVPPDGPGIRVDSGITVNSEISVHYDPLVAKLIAFGRDRNEAIARMKRALREFQIAGIHTTIPFCQMVMSEKSFQKGEFNTGFVEKFWRDMVADDRDKNLFEIVAVAVKALQSGTVRNPGTNHSANSRNGVSSWKLRGQKEALR